MSSPIADTLDQPSLRQREPLPDLTVDLAPGAKRELILRNPVMTASGTSSNGLEFARLFDIIVWAVCCPKASRSSLGEAIPHRGSSRRRLAC